MSDPRDIHEAFIRLQRPRCGVQRCGAQRPIRAESGGYEGGLVTRIGGLSIGIPPRSGIANSAELSTLARGSFYAWSHAGLHRDGTWLDQWRKARVLPERAEGVQRPLLWVDPKTSPVPISAPVPPRDRGEFVTTRRKQHEQQRTRRPPPPARYSVRCSVSSIVPRLQPLARDARWHRARRRCGP